MWRVERNGATTCEPPARLRARKSLTPHENMENLKAALTALKTHHMCARFIEEPTAYIVYYPPGMYPHGCRASFNRFSGRIHAVNRMLSVMDRPWKENGITPPSAAPASPDPSP
jgi:hypothetical protein